jgi:hypothetical protein
LFERWRLRRATARANQRGITVLADSSLKSSRSVPWAVCIFACLSPHQMFLVCTPQGTFDPRTFVSKLTAPYLTTVTAQVRATVDVGTDEHDFVFEQIAQAAAEQKKVWLCNVTSSALIGVRRSSGRTRMSPIRGHSLSVSAVLAPASRSPLLMARCCSVLRDRQIRSHSSGCSTKRSRSCSRCARRSKTTFSTSLTTRRTPRTATRRTLRSTRKCCRCALACSADSASVLQRPASAAQRLVRLHCCSRRVLSAAANLHQIQAVRQPHRQSLAHLRPHQ